MYIDILDLEVEDFLYKKLEKYLEILLFWQRSLNLISNDTITNAWQRHFYDSLQLIKEIKAVEESKKETLPRDNTQNISSESLNVFDLGSGAGFPGLVLAVIDTKNKYYLIESNSKKTAFLSEIVRVLELKNVIVVNKRIEDFSKENIKADIILSRGLTKLDSLVDSARMFSKQDSVCIFLKGQNYLQEIDGLNSKNKSLVNQISANQECNLKVSVKQSLTNHDSKIIIVENI
ncbi:MAG: 16S rRNA (guanine(527)-N(7))-methyltransferase RsmG [Alphaproteobacteria bacterium]|nr:16S rRNA (guanine(527)-N(7))-methyltransferase RsmG [Alphaproteobacteria bacterium]